MSRLLLLLLPWVFVFYMILLLPSLDWFSSVVRFVGRWLSLCMETFNSNKSRLEQSHRDVRSSWKLILVRLGRPLFLTANHSASMSRHGVRRREDFWSQSCHFRMQTSWRLSTRHSTMSRVVRRGKGSLPEAVGLRVKMTSSSICTDFADRCAVTHSRCPTYWRLISALQLHCQTATFLRLSMHCFLPSSVSSNSSSPLHLLFADFCGGSLLFYCHVTRSIAIHTAVRLVVCRFNTLTWFPLRMLECLINLVATSYAHLNTWSTWRLPTMHAWMVGQLGSSCKLIIS